MVISLANIFERVFVREESGDVRGEMRNWSKALSLLLVICKPFLYAPPRRCKHTAYDTHGLYTARGPRGQGAATNDRKRP